MTEILVLNLITLSIVSLHGYTPTDLLKSSIMSISKDVQVSLSNIDSYRGFVQLYL